MEFPLTLALHFVGNIGVWRSLKDFLSSRIFPFFPSFYFVTHFTSLHGKHLFCMFSYYIIAICDIFLQFDISSTWHGNFCSIFQYREGSFERIAIKPASNCIVDAEESVYFMCYRGRFRSYENLVLWSYCIWLLVDITSNSAPETSFRRNLSTRDTAAKNHFLRCLAAITTLILSQTRTFVSLSVLWYIWISLQSYDWIINVMFWRFFFVFRIFVELFWYDCVEIFRHVLLTAPIAISPLTIAVINRIKWIKYYWS